MYRHGIYSCTYVGSLIAYAVMIWYLLDTVVAIHCTVVTVVMCTPGNEMSRYENMPAKQVVWISTSQYMLTLDTLDVHIRILDNHYQYNLYHDSQCIRSSPQYVAGHGLQ